MKLALAMLGALAFAPVAHAQAARPAPARAPAVRPAPAAAPPVAKPAAVVAKPAPRPVSPKPALAKPAAPRAGSAETALMESYFRTLQTGYAADASVRLFAQTPLAQRNAQIPDKLSNAAATYLNFYGPVVRWAFVKEKVYAPGIKRQYWVIYTPNAPIFVTVDLYQTETGLAVQNINLNDKYEDALD